MINDSLQLNEKPWLSVLWDASRKIMIVRYQQLAQNLFLYMIGQSPYPDNYDLLSKYRNAVGDGEADLNDIR